MTKQAFLDELRERLMGLPQKDRDERLTFYSEMIDDRMEESPDEEVAVAGIGSVDAVAEQIIADTPLITITKEKLRPKRKIKTRELVLLIAGSPVWAPLLISAVAVTISLYAVLWSVIASLWAVFAALCGGSVGGVGIAVITLIQGQALDALAILGMSLAAAGLAIFAFFGCLEATKGTVLWTQKMALGIKKRFVGKEIE